jgi:hypothetical protein
MAASFDSEKPWKRMEAQLEPLPVPGRKRTMMHDKTDCPGSRRCFMRRQEAIGGEDAAASRFSPGNEVLGCLEDAHAHGCFSNQEHNVPPSSIPAPAKWTLRVPTCWMAR